MIQIIGTKKCKTTAKAIRYFKERGVAYQFKDLTVKELAVGELDKISQKVDIDDLIDDESALYDKKGLLYMEYDPREEILEDNRLLKTPILRNGADVIVGYNPDGWKKWVEDEQKI